MMLSMALEFIARFHLFGSIIYVTSSLLIHHFQENQAMIAAIFGYQVGKYLGRHPEEELFNFLCVVSVTGFTLYLLCKCNFLIRSINLGKCLRLLAIFRVVVSAALLSYLAIIMYSRKMEMEGDYIGWMLGNYGDDDDPLMSRLYPRYGVRYQSSFLSWLNIFLA